jgi:phosphoribosylanthranilate isomerase
VAQAIAQVKPYAVDVSGGVESAKGIKDVAKMAAFMQQVNI